MPLRQAQDRLAQDLVDLAQLTDLAFQRLYLVRHLGRDTSPLAFDADEWDTGPGDSASFPLKWMRADGTTLHLVFSGDDSFSVRQANLVLGQQNSASAVRP